jgi:hypothetical protein
MMADALVSLITITLLVCLFYGPWQTVCIDAARQHIFARRDAMFDLARNGKLEFGSEEYRTVREFFQRSIRFAHEATWIRVAFTYRSLEKLGALSSESKVLQALARIDDVDTRQQVSELVNEAIFALIAAMVFRSAILIFFGVVAVTCGGITKAVMALPKWVSATMRAEAENSATASSI